MPIRYAIRSTSCAFISISLVAAMYLFITSRCPKIRSSRHSSLILYTPSSSIVTHLSSDYTLRPRSKPLFHPLSFSLSLCSDSSLSLSLSISRLPTQPSQKPSSIFTFYTPPYDRPLAAPRLLNLYLSDFYPI